MRGQTPPRMREPPPLDTVRRQAASFVEVEEYNPLKEKSSGRGGRARDADGMSHEQVRAMLLKQHPDLDAVYIDGVIAAFDEDANGTIDMSEFKKLHAVLLAAQPFEETGFTVHHGLDREEALAMINGMDLDITPDYIHGVWDAYDTNGDGHLDEGEFSKLVAALRRSQADGRAPSKSQAAGKTAQTGSCAKRTLMALGAFIFLVFIVSLAMDQYEAHFGDEATTPAPRRQNAPVVTAGEMTLTGSASVDDIRGGLTAATGGSVTISSFTQRVSADATLPISASEFDAQAEDQFVRGVAIAVSVPVDSIVDVTAVDDPGRRRQLQSSRRARISYAIEGQQGEDLKSATQTLQAASFAARLVESINDAGDVLPALLASEIAVSEPVVTTEVQYSIAAVVEPDADAREVQRSVDSAMRDNDSLIAAIEEQGGEDIEAIQVEVAVEVATVTPPPPPPPPPPAIVAGACSSAELWPTQATVATISRGCSACMAEVDRTYSQDGADNALHHRVRHCGTPSAATSSCDGDHIRAVVERPEIAHRLQRQVDGAGRRHLQTQQPRGSQCRDCVRPVTTAIHTGVTHTTYQLALATGAAVENIYTIFGDGASMMRFPPARQVAAPFGVDVGGVHPAIIESNANAAYDSWLTVGISGGNTANAISSIGIDFTGWNEASELRVSNGAVFWMSPGNGPTASRVLVAQVTVASGAEWSATVSAQGRSSGAGGDWSQTGIEFVSSAPAISHDTSTRCRDCVRPVITAIHTGETHTTYQLALATLARVENVYTIYGDGAYVMRFPPARQVSTPFGVDIGGVHPAIIESNADAAYDSWLTVGISDSSTIEQMRSIGIDFTGWNEASELRVSNGAVFWMSPDDGPTASRVLVAQVTVASGAEWSATVSAQGRSSGAGGDWTTTGIEFVSRSYAADQLALVAQQIAAECLGCISSSQNAFQECVSEAAMPAPPQDTAERICTEQDEQLVRFESDSVRVADASRTVSSPCVSCIAWDRRDAGSEHNDAVSACAVEPPPPPPAVCTGFDCAGEINQIATDPGSITCDGATCTAAECCTVRPPPPPSPPPSPPPQTGPPPPPPVVCTGFSCAAATNDIAPDPGSIVCQGSECTAEECCTVPPASCEGATYSANGLAPCTDCAEPLVVNADRTACTACPAGQGPNTDRTSCVACASGQYSANGVCEVCPARHVVSLDRTQCNPRTCADINADGVATDNFDCANSANDLSSTPASVICRTNPCTALECCTVAPPPPRTCADTDADGVADQFDCSNHQNDLTGNPERTLCSGDACSAPQCCTLAPVVAAATSSPGASVEVHETSTTMSVGGYVTLRLMYSLSAAQANVYAMSGTATARMQFPAAFQVAAPFGADVGGVPEGFFPFMDSEFDSWLTVGLTGGNTGGELALSPGFGIGAWTATSAFETDNGAVFWMTPENGPTERTPLTFAQLTITTEAYAAGGFAQASLQGRSAQGDDWSGLRVEWRW